MIQLRQTMVSHRAAALWGIIVCFVDFPCKLLFVRSDVASTSNLLFHSGQSHDKNHQLYR